MVLLTAIDASETSLFVFDTLACIVAEGSIALHSCVESTFVEVGSIEIEAELHTAWLVRLVDPPTLVTFA